MPLGGGAPVILLCLGCFGRLMRAERWGAQLGGSVVLNQNVTFGRCTPPMRALLACAAALAVALVWSVAARRPGAVLGALARWKRWRDGGFGTPAASAADETMRFGLFLVQASGIGRVNSANVTYEVGTTPFADLAFSEWAAIFGEPGHQGDGAGGARDGSTAGILARDASAIAVPGGLLDGSGSRVLRRSSESRQRAWTLGRAPPSRGCGRPGPCASLS